jgi:hypothetical protein
MPEIKVHEKALAHLSRGLYRSPASAIRELVSNAWDANARLVEIDTNYPLFMRLTIQDNGEGFSRRQFATLMGGGIGNSEKRPTGEQLRYGRPVIGRLGIGMLGIAQICGSFTITSKLKNGQGFRANIKLYDLIKKKLDENDPTVVAGDVVDVGEYEFDKSFDPANARVGTSIATDDVHPTFVRSFQQSAELKASQKIPSDWRKAIRLFSSVRSIQELGDYWRLVWELSASCPIPYVAADAVPRGLIRGDQERLDSYNFRVTVDGLELKKPVYLKGNKAGYTTQQIGEQYFRPYGRDLKFHGYLIVQEGTQLRPDELRGILIRIKNVGIGYYDPSMLDYRINHGPRSRWVTGEIYVDEGLEDALNIDRDSFNRFHPEFKELQRYVHEALSGEVFPRVYKQIDVRSLEKAERVKADRRSHLSDAIAETIDAKTSVRNARSSTERDCSYPEVKEKGNTVTIVLPNESTLPVKNAQRQLALSMLALFEVALRESTQARRRDLFRSLLLSLLSKW